MAPGRERHQAGVTKDLALVETVNCTKWVWDYEDELRGWRLAVSVAYNTVKPTSTGTVLYPAVAQQVDGSSMLGEQKCQAESYAGWTAKYPLSSDCVASKSYL